ncbi:hypothetical protein NE237_003327 [Protea cynaroides]|uniref:phosphoribosylaminoimidazole carboxylase n=1 Tax=Protea cynaroides TaxID=273540 RepID=A0A9Q0QSH1_9MAGN|nr:hypothetical protein NE237_003327 [Protea cynaroides]
MTRSLATDIAQKAVSSLEGVGVFAVELFLTRDGDILLNEVAPRPHNSGRHTIESCFTSQYEQHLRAVVGLPLGDPSMKTPAAILYNLLGAENGEPGLYLAHQLIGRALGVPGASQRKMGHITIVGPTMGRVERLLNSMLSEESLEGQNFAIPLVGIIMGSDSDLPVMSNAANTLNSLGVPVEVKIIIIAGVGGVAHLPGMVAALTLLPVIGVPVRASSLDGLGSLLSIVQMPRGVPVATVAINNARNAALLAARILAVGDGDLQARITQYQQDLKDDVLRKADRLEKDGWAEYSNR